jgi:hypothetical protein
MHHNGLWCEPGFTRTVRRTCEGMTSLRAILSLQLTIPQRPTDGPQRVLLGFPVKAPQP